MSVLHFIISCWSQTIWQHCYNMRRAGLEKMHQGLNSQTGKPHHNPTSMLKQCVRELSAGVQLWNANFLRDGWFQSRLSAGRKKKTSLCVTRKCPWAKLSEYGCSHAWMFPGTLKTEERTGIRHSRRDMCHRREQPRQHALSLKRFEIFCFLFFIQCPHIFFFFFKNLLEKWKPLADKKSQTTSQRHRTDSIKWWQIRAKLRRAYCLVYKNSGIEITSSSTDMTS